METLELYSEMEVMRFQKKVSYRMEVDPEIETDTIEIPPLLIQPFAENAVWHGLMHKEAGGTITVTVAQPALDLLRITITDDGIGRERAAELKSKSAVRQKSLGMKVTEDRIALINQLYHTRAWVEVTDLKDASGQATGTRVMVEIQV